MSGWPAVVIVLMLVAVPALAPRANENQRPFSCRLLTDEQRKCALGNCDPRVIERLKRECLRNGGSALLFPRAGGPGMAASEIHDGVPRHIDAGP
jgi:hypothetical protein